MSIINENLYELNFSENGLDKNQPVIINESKTPLAHVHAGSLRRIFLHYQLAQKLSEIGYKTGLWIGNDDYDPYDYFPAYFTDKQKNLLKPYLGHPLCSVPAPEGDGNYANYYFDEMIGILQRSFGIIVKTYRTSELYRDGKFDDGIRLVLKNLNKLNDLYESVTGKENKFTEKPLQVICPNCGNMRTTRILKYVENNQVQIICQNYELKGVKFVGCGFNGRLSPFRGNARLFWKLEWPVRWYYMNIGVEGSRKDQNSDLGARKFAEAAFTLLFQQQPPSNLPYDFCYIRSENSPQVNRFGISADTALKFLPPQLFFDLLTIPRSVHVIDLDLESEEMLEIYKDYSKRAFNDKDGIIFNEMLEAARYKKWIDADPFKNELVGCLMHYLNTSRAERSWCIDLSIKRSTNDEKVFLDTLDKNLMKLSDWYATEIQNVFTKTAMETKINIKDACRMMYKHLINRGSGPRIGLLLEKIGKDRLLGYLKSC